MRARSSAERGGAGLAGAREGAFGGRVFAEGRGAGGGAGAFAGVVEAGAAGVA